MELDYYHQKVNVRITSRVNDLQLRDLGKKETLRKSLECLDFMVSIQPATLKVNFDIGARKSRKISSKTFHGETDFTYTIFCPRLLL